MTVANGAWVKDIELEIDRPKNLLAEAQLDSEALKLVARGKGQAQQSGGRRFRKGTGIAATPLRPSRHMAICACMYSCAVMLFRTSIGAYTGCTGIRRWRKRQGVATDLTMLARPGSPNQVWSLGFVFYGLITGRRIKCVTVVVDLTIESITAFVDHFIRDLRVVGAPDEVAQVWGYHVALLTNHGPEFTGRALDWRGVALTLIQAGKPTQNTFIESFNGKFRNGCLNDHWFGSLAAARIRLAAWHRYLNENRPHNALGSLAPPIFAALWRASPKTELQESQPVPAKLRMLLISGAGQQLPGEIEAKSCYVFLLPPREIGVGALATNYK